MNAFPQGLHVPPLRAEPAATVPPVRLRRAPKQRLAPGIAAPYGGLLGPGLLLLYGCVLSATGWLDPRILPAPWTAVTTGIDLIGEGRLQQHLAVSAGRAMTGLGFGITIGAALALLHRLLGVEEASFDDGDDRPPAGARIETYHRRRGKAA